MSQEQRDRNVTYLSPHRARARIDPVVLVFWIFAMLFLVWFWFWLVPDLYQHVQSWILNHLAQMNDASNYTR